MNKLKGNSNLELKDEVRIAVLGGGPVSKSTSETNENLKIPKWLDKIVLKCLGKSPSDRYQEVGHLQKMLKTYSIFYID